MSLQRWPSVLWSGRDAGTCTCFVYIYLFPHSKILEMEVFSFSRRKLRSCVDTPTQMINDAVVAEDARHCLTLHHEMGVTILVLACCRNHNHSFEVERTLILSRTFFVKTCYDVCCEVTLVHDRSVLLRHGVQRLLLLEVEHCCCRGLDDNKIDALTHLISLGVENITGHIIADVVLDICIHPYFGYRA